MQRTALKCLLICAGMQSVCLLFAEHITILFTHDLHSMYLPHQKRNSAGAAEWRGGYARLYTAIEKVRAQQPTQTIVVDAGDFSSGSLLYSLFPDHCAELQLMAHMGYHVTTLGNHDFDYTTDGLAKALTAAKQTGLPLPAIVAANLRPEDPSLQALKKAFDSYPVTEYVVIERAGKRIGLFGLLGDEARSNAPAAAALTFENRFEVTRRMVKHLREKEQVSLIVCLSHSGTHAHRSRSEDEQLARKVAGIDVLISAHSHTERQEPLLVNRTHIVSAGCYAACLGVLTIDTETKALHDYYLQPIDSTLLPNASMIAKIQAFQEQVNRHYFPSPGRQASDTVGVSPCYLPAEPKHAESTLGNLIADAFVHAAHRHLPSTVNKQLIAVVPRGTIRSDLFAGPITEEQLFRILPSGVGNDRKVGYPLVCVYLTGRELWDLCEIDASCAQLMPDAQLSFSGLRYTYNPYRLFCNKVTDVQLTTPSHPPVAPGGDSLYPVIGSLYSVQMLGAIHRLTRGILSIQPKDRNGRPVHHYPSAILHIHQNTAPVAELKEWLALSEYLHAARLAEQCAAAQLPRKTIDPHRSPVALLKQPNHFALLLYAAGLLLLTGLAAALWLWTRKRWKHKIQMGNGE